MIVSVVEDSRCLLMRGGQGRHLSNAGHLSCPWTCQLRRRRNSALAARALWWGYTGDGTCRFCKMIGPKMGARRIVHAIVWHFMMVKERGQERAAPYVPTHGSEENLVRIQVKTLNRCDGLHHCTSDTSYSRPLTHCSSGLRAYKQRTNKKKLTSCSTLLIVALSLIGLPPTRVAIEQFFWG